MLASGCICRGDFHCNIATRPLTPSQPNSRVPPKTKLVNNAITPVAERVTNVNGVKPTRFIVPWILDVFKELVGAG